LPPVIELLNWILTPGQVVVLPGSHPTLPSEGGIWNLSDLMSKYPWTMSTLINGLADNITQQFDSDLICLFDFDTKDFIRCARQGRLYACMI